MAKIMMRTISEGPAQLLHFLEFKPMQFALSHIEPCFGHLVASRCQVPPWWWKPSMPTRSRSWKRPWRQGMDGLKLLKMVYKQSLIEDIWRVFFDGFCVCRICWEMLGCCNICRQWFRVYSRPCCPGLCASSESTRAAEHHGWYSIDFALLLGHRPLTMTNMLLNFTHLCFTVKDLMFWVNPIV